MRDRGPAWPPASEAPAPTELGGAVLRRVRPARQVILSGPRVLTLDAPPQVGWPDVAPDGPHALRLRRDRLLVVDGPAMPEGWDGTAGLAATVVTAGLAVLEVEGPDALGIVGRGAPLDPAMPSRGAARRLFGLDVALCRHGHADRFRIHVDRALADALWRALAQAAARR